MPGAGFYAIGASRIVFGRDGEWYADGERITNPRIALLFSRHLVRRPDGTWAVEMGDERAPVEIEDTPWVVTDVDGDPGCGFQLRLNDQNREPLDLSTLAIEPDHAFSCAVKGGRERARFLRKAHYVFARYVTPACAPGTFMVEAGGRRYDVAARSPRD